MSTGINGKGSNIVDNTQADEAGKSVGSPTNTDGDELAQFHADRFIADHFRLVSRPKKKRAKEVIRGPAEGAQQEQTRFHSGLSPCKMDDNHNTHECGTVEDPKRRPPDLRQNEPRILAMDSAKLKTKEVDTLLTESFEAYNSGHYGPAATKYRMAWEMITDATPESHIEKINEHVVCYMLALSLLKTNQPNNLSEAVKLLVALEKRCSAIFPAVYYAISLAHHKHYRFAQALKTIEEGSAILESNANLTEYRIPGSNDILKESTKDGLSASFAQLKDECSKWHPPDAVCCMSDCLPSSQWYGPDRNIYFSDPTFNGMVVLTCGNTKNPCTIKFHLACWKLKKDQLSGLKKLSDKDIILAGYKCFTPNCEYDQGGHSLITTIEVYEDDGTLKTRVDAPANPVVWGKRKPPTKGALPKQQKPKRTMEKTRRPVATAVAPRASSKEAGGENRAEKEWRLAKLAILRRNNFGINPDCEWRPDVEMYGNPQMMEIRDFLGPIFENDEEKMAAIKTFVFTYFYEFIKEIGCIKRNEISQKWEEDKFIFDNYSDILHNENDICEFLLQSYKLVSIGEYIGIAENLPQLYTVVGNEVCRCLRFLLADSLQTPAVQDDAVDVVSGDYDEMNKLLTAGAGRDTKTDTAIDSDNIQHTDGTPLIGRGDMFSTTVPTACLDDSETNDVDTFERLENKVFFQKSITRDGLSSAVDLPIIRNDGLESGDPNGFGGTELNGGRADCERDSNPGKDGAGERDVASTEGISGLVDNQPHDWEQTNSSSPQEKESDEGTDIAKLEDDKPMGSGGCGPGMNGEAAEMEPQLRRPGSELELVVIDEDRSADEVRLDDEVPQSLVNSNAPDIELPKSSAEAEQDSDTLTGTMLVDNEQKSINLPSSRGQNIMAESNVQKIESDLASMADTITRLKSVLEKYQVKSQTSENYARVLQQEFLNHKQVSQAGTSELVKDFNRLEAHCARLEAEKSEITYKYQECLLDLRRTSDDNVALKLSNTELTYKYDKLGEEKTDLEVNLDILKREKSAIENNLETLQRERDKMDKKLQKYHARLKDKSCVDAETMINQQKERRDAEQRATAASRLSERKLKLQSLTHEFNLNKYALDKAFEKCFDQLNMLKDASRLVTLATGQQFVATEAQGAWQETEYRLRPMVAQYKEKYMELKALLESDDEIENLEDVKLPTLNIRFPEPPNLTELYYKRQTSFQRHQIPVLPAPWAVPGVYQDPRFLVPAASISYPGKNFEIRVNANIPTEPVHLANHSPQKFPTIDDMDYYRTNYMSQPINGAGCQRVQDTAQQGPGIIAADRTLVETENLGNTAPRQDLTLQDTGECAEGIVQASQCTTAVVTNTPQGISPIPVIGRAKGPTPSKQIGKDQLMHELKKKFIGVPELDLLHSVDDVRKLHKDTLSGMRIEDIIRESEPYVKQRQEKHMAYYLQTKQMLPPERTLLPQSKTNQRKVAAPLGKTYPRIIETIDRSSKYVSGQQKKIRFGAQEQPNMLGIDPSDASTVVPAAMKKPAWRPVASGLVDWIKNEEDSECTICFESMSAYNKRAPMYVLPCQHSFHTTCIKQWLGENSVCPICRIHCTMDDEFPPLPS